MGCKSSKAARQAAAQPPASAGTVLEEQRAVEQKPAEQQAPAVEQQAAMAEESYAAQAPATERKEKPTVLEQVRKAIEKKVEAVKEAIVG
eukprot:CAMPEP_0183384612 /NCGR_PEP_ID=MMETSP0370-20130417/710_1 /TAXON_ID=268820 /ORGANISM="Peridinium aciculiferum, Strain PAER-2" /LENGTH=89 /DNA_ID=CAMNT_0025562399 /DNA_START=63 /DNA_END=329 /DNA_ORIENTATION=-